MCCSGGLGTMWIWGEGRELPRWVGNLISCRVVSGLMDCSGCMDGTWK